MIAQTISQRKYFFADSKNRWKNKPTFYDPCVNSSFHLTEAPQYILHEVLKSCN